MPQLKSPCCVRCKNPRLKAVGSVSALMSFAAGEPLLLGSWRNCSLATLASFSFQGMKSLFYLWGLYETLLSFVFQTALFRNSCSSNFCFGIKRKFGGGEGVNGNLT